MRVLVIGSGGREHALCWKLAQSEALDPARGGRLFCAPGNPGTAQVASNVAIGATDLDRLVDFARREAIDLTVVGPEAPLCAGLADRFAAAGHLICGPSQAAAQLEGSKIFAKAFMARCGVLTPAAEVFSDVAAAQRYIDAHPQARVIKADGLCAGKGVHVCQTAAEAKAAVASVLGGPLAGQGRVLVEEKLDGEELSVMALCDGQRIKLWAGSQDHKALEDGDRGPNTGGMGAYSPAPLLDQALAEEIAQGVILPVVAEMAAQQTPYRGVLYAGLMVCAGRPYVLEFNCRLGDPETQPLLCRLKSDLLPLLHGAAAGALPEASLSWDDRAALCVVLAAAGYPGTYATGARIEGLARAAALDGVTVFHAGTVAQGDQLRTAGGRVLGVTALGKTIAAAQKAAYRAVDQIRWPGMTLRRDIGWRAIAKER